LLRDAVRSYCWLIMEEMIDSMAVDEDFDLMHCLYIV